MICALSRPTAWWQLKLRFWLLLKDFRKPHTRVSTNLITVRDSSTIIVWAACVSKVASVMIMHEGDHRRKIDS